MRRLFALLALTAFAATPVMAREDKTEEKAGAVDNPDKMVCKAIKEVGSHIPQRVCRTKAQWAEMTRAAEEIMRNRSHSSMCGDSAICGRK